MGQLARQEQIMNDVRVIFDDILKKNLDKKTNWNSMTCLDGKMNSAHQN